MNSSNIFNISPLGCNILIPHYISEIKRVLRGQGAGNDVKTKCVLIITSLICYPNHLETLGSPMDFSVKGAEYNFATVIIFIQLYKISMCSNNSHLFLLLHHSN